MLKIFLSNCFIQTKDQHDVIKQLKAQLSTLSASLTTISSEKSRIEAQFQADRKRLLTEKDDVSMKLYNNLLQDVKFVTLTHILPFLPSVGEIFSSCL